MDTKIYKNKSGLEFRVIQLLTNRRRLVEFLESGYVANCHQSAIIKGSVKDRLNRTVQSVGFLGEYVEYTRKEYLLWESMFHRVHTDSYYAECSICERWEDLSNFVKDIRKFENYSRWAEGKKYDIDKDTLYKGNKVYSPQFCTFITSFDNKSAAFLNIRNKGIEKAFRAVHEDGTTLIFKNKSKFAREYGLNRSAVSKAEIKGGTTKGWKIKEVTD